MQTEMKKNNTKRILQKYYAKYKKVGLLMHGERKQKRKEKKKTT